MIGNIAPKITSADDISSFFILFSTLKQRNTDNTYVDDNKIYKIIILFFFRLFFFFHKDTKLLSLCQ
jgi:hypothetical protein